jgi:predicted amidohydrolase
LATVLQGLEYAAAAGLDIVSFPESMLTGYYRKEADAQANSFAIDSPQLQEVLAKTARFDLVFMVGFNEQRDGKLHNTIAVIEQGKLLGRYSKAMPVFSYFVPGREFPVFEKQGLKFGVVICADGGYIEPARIVSLKGAQVIFAPHFNFIANPVQHFQKVRNDHIARAVENGVYFLRGNNVEPTRSIEGLADIGYGYGDSYLIDPNGQMVAAAGLYRETLMIYNFDLENNARAAHNRRSRTSATELLGILEEVLDTRQ